MICGHLLPSLPPSLPPSLGLNPEAITWVSRARVRFESYCSEALTSLWKARERQGPRSRRQVMKLVMRRPGARCWRMWGRKLWKGFSGTFSQVAPLLLERLAGESHNCWYLQLAHCWKAAPRWSLVQPFESFYKSLLLLIYITCFVKYFKCFLFFNIPWLKVFRTEICSAKYIFIYGNLW